MKKLFWRMVCVVLGHLDPQPAWVSRFMAFDGYFCPACDRWVKR